jgi:hypothetical protein
MPTGGLLLMAVAALDETSSGERESGDRLRQWFVVEREVRLAEPSTTDGRTFFSWLTQSSINTLYGNFDACCGRSTSVAGGVLEHH